MEIERIVLHGPQALHGAALRLPLVLVQPAGCQRAMGGAWYRVPPGGVITRHRHATKAELWIIIQGRGRAWLDEVETSVGPGTAIYTPPLTSHRLENPGPEDLILVNATHPPVEGIDPATGGRPGTEELEEVP